MVSRCERGREFRERMSYSFYVVEVVSHVVSIGNVLAVDRALERRARHSLGDQVV